MDKYDNVLFWNDNRIIDDMRFEMLDQNSMWNLRIKEVSPLDAGKYRCVTNTEPVQYRFYELIVYGNDNFCVENISILIEICKVIATNWCSSHQVLYSRLVI